MMSTVQALFRYPVKSMLGEPLDALALSDEGVVGDRAYAVVDCESGKVLSAKDPDRWGALLQCRAGYPRELVPDGELMPVEVRLPDGTRMSSGEPGFLQRLGAVLGTEVDLVSGTLPEAVVDLVEAESRTRSAHTLPLAASGRFVDYGAVHLVTGASLHRLGAAHAASGEAARYRPNVVVAVDEEGFVENGWVGRTLQLGREVQLRVSVLSPRCVVPTAAHGALAADRQVLRTVAAHNRQPVAGSGRLPCVGAYAEVVRPGIVERGDRVVLRS